MKNKEMIRIIAIIIAVALLTSFINLSITGNSIKVLQGSNGTDVYTVSELNAIVDSLKLEITTIKSKLDVCCPDKGVLGNLNLVTIPIGARVYVNSEYIGEAPVDIKDLPIGEYNLSVHKYGYRDESMKAFINKGDNHLTVELKKDTLTSNVIISSTPTGASIEIDGVIYSDIAPYNVRGLRVGEHTFKFTKQGFNNYTVVNNLKEGDNVMNVALTQAI